MVVLSIQVCIGQKAAKDTGPAYSSTDERLLSERRTRGHFVGNLRDDAEFKCLIAPSAKGPFRVYSILPRSVILLTILLDFATLTTFVKRTWSQLLSRDHNN